MIPIWNKLWIVLLILALRENKVIIIIIIILNKMVGQQQQDITKEISGKPEIISQKKLAYVKLQARETWPPWCPFLPFILTLSWTLQIFGEASDPHFLLAAHCWVWCHHTKARCSISSSLCDPFDCGKQVYVSVAFQTKFSQPLTSPWTPGSLCVSQQSSALPPICMYDTRCGRSKPHAACNVEF